MVGNVIIPNVLMDAKFDLEEGERMSSALLPYILEAAGLMDGGGN